MQDSIHQIVREATDNYVHGTTKHSKYVNRSMYLIIERIEAYLNSKFIDGDQDSLGRDKPFFNIVTAACNIWYRATDLDRKNVKILPDTSANTGLAFLATVQLQRWMDKARFGVFLNQWGRALARYGSAVVKFVEKEGELVATVIPWNRFIADPVDFNAIPRIEKFYKTPSQLRKEKNYDQETVDRLIKAKQARETLEGFDKDNESNFVEIYEVHGDLPTYFLDDKPEAPLDDKEIKYRQQMHVISFLETKEGKYDDYTLYKGKEAKDPYMITHLIEEDGQTLSIGAVEYLFDAQWMQNHSMKQWKDQVDLASKLIFQTADQNYVGRNVLSAVEIGDIMVHEVNKPLTLINNQGHDIASIQGFSQAWRVIEKEVTSTPDAARGNNPPSGQPLGATQIITNEGMSLFEVMTENKGLAIEEMLREFVIPHLKSKLDTTEEITAVLDESGISEIDSLYIPKEAIRRFNKNAREEILNGRLPQPFTQPLAEDGVRQDLALSGNKRFFKPSELDDKSWKEVLKGEFWDNLRVEVTDENKDKKTVLATLSNLLQTIVGLQGRPMSQDERMVFNSILSETSVISPLQLSKPSTSPPIASPPGVGAGALPANAT